MGQYDTALTHLEIAETICQQQIESGLESLAYARTQVNRGCIYSSQNRYRDCGEIFGTALRIRQRLLDPDDQLLANSYMNMGNYYTSQELFEEAAKTHREVLRIRHKAKRPLLAQLIISHYNLARCLLGDNDLEGAEEAVEGAVSHLSKLPNQADRDMNDAS